jgi:hypothetical protein
VAKPAYPYPSNTIFDVALALAAYFRLVQSGTHKNFGLPASRCDPCNYWRANIRNPKYLLDLAPSGHLSMQRLGEEYCIFVRIDSISFFLAFFFPKPSLRNRAGWQSKVVSSLLILDTFFCRYSPEFAGSDLDGISGLAHLIDTEDRSPWSGYCRSWLAWSRFSLICDVLVHPVWCLCSGCLPHYP